MVAGSTWRRTRAGVGRRPRASRREPGICECRHRIAQRICFGRFRTGSENIRSGSRTDSAGGTRSRPLRIAGRGGRRFRGAEQLARCRDCCQCPEFVAWPRWIEGRCDAAGCGPDRRICRRPRASGQLAEAARIRGAGVAGQRESGLCATCVIETSGPCSGSREFFGIHRRQFRLRRPDTARSCIARVSNRGSSRRDAGWCVDWRAALCASAL